MASYDDVLNAHNLHELRMQAEKSVVFGPGVVKVEAEFLMALLDSHEDQERLRAELDDQTEKQGALLDSIDDLKAEVSELRAALRSTDTEE